MSWLHEVIHGSAEWAIRRAAPSRLSPARRMRVRAVPSTSPVHFEVPAGRCQIHGARPYSAARFGTCRVEPPEAEIVRIVNGSGLDGPGGGEALAGRLGPGHPGVLPVDVADGFPGTRIGLAAVELRARDVSHAVKTPLLSGRSAMHSNCGVPTVYAVPQRLASRTTAPACLELSVLAPGTGAGR